MPAQTFFETRVVIVNGIAGTMQVGGQLQNFPERRSRGRGVHKFRERIRIVLVHHDNAIVPIQNQDTTGNALQGILEPVAVRFRKRLCRGGGGDVLEHAENFLDGAVVAALAISLGIDEPNAAIRPHDAQYELEVLAVTLRIAEASLEMRAVLIMVIIDGLTAPGFVRVVEAVNAVDFIRPEHVIG